MWFSLTVISCSAGVVGFAFTEKDKTLGFLFFFFFFNVWLLFPYMEHIFLFFSFVMWSCLFSRKFWVVETCSWWHLTSSPFLCLPLCPRAHTLSNPSISALRKEPNKFSHGEGQMTNRTWCSPARAVQVSITTIFCKKGNLQYSSRLEGSLCVLGLEADSWDLKEEKISGTCKNRYSLFLSLWGPRISWFPQFFWYRL